MNGLSAMRPIVIALALLPVTALLAAAQPPDVRILFFTGNVTVRGGKAAQPAAIGLALSARDLITIPKGGSLQLSVNGTILPYTQGAKVRVSDAIKRAGTAGNPLIADVLRTIDSAGEAGQSPEPAPAATEGVTANKRRKGSTRGEVAATSRRRKEPAPPPVPAEPAPAPAGDMGTDLIILEPRSTAVPSGPVRFRWLRSPSAGRYVVSVKNYLGEEVFSRETTDTAVLWEDAKLPEEVIYTWTLTDKGNTAHNTGAIFHRLNDSSDAALRDGFGVIRRELGPDNPAVPVLLGALCAGAGCYGEAANYFTIGALTTRQHFNALMLRARAQYQNRMYMPDEEAQIVYTAR